MSRPQVPASYDLDDLEDFDLDIRVTTSAAESEVPLHDSRACLREPELEQIPVVLVDESTERPLPDHPEPEHYECMWGLNCWLWVVATVLPRTERYDWLEENKGYLRDIETRFERALWVLRQLLAMPRYAYAVHTDRKKESA